MSKADLQLDLRALYREAGDGQTLPVLMDGVCAALARHPDALAGITGRYAVLAADTGFACAFALSSGVFSPLAPDAPVDVSIVGGEADLLAVFRHELAPLKALLGGKVRVRGDRAALMRFAPFLRAFARLPGFFSFSLRLTAGVFSGSAFLLIAARPRPAACFFCGARPCGDGIF